MQMGWNKPLASQKLRIGARRFSARFGLAVWLAGSLTGWVAAFALLHYYMALRHG